jgi:hypothetical protein
MCHLFNNKIIKKTHKHQCTLTWTQITWLLSHWARDWPITCHRCLTRVEEGRGEACIQLEVRSLLQNFCYLGHSLWECLPMISEKCAMWSLESSNRGCFLKTLCYEVPELRCQCGKWRITEVDWTKTVNLTLNVMVISRGFEKFTYCRGFLGIEGRTTEVLL